jgi:hypothetical protein
MSKNVLEKGGNAVLGYHQSFDVEGDSGIVARTYVSAENNVFLTSKISKNSKILF